MIRNGDSVRLSEGQVRRNDAVAAFRAYALPALIVTYILAALLGASAGAFSPLINSALITPLYFLLPTGFGLFLLYALSSESPRFLERSQIIVLAFMTGLVAITVLYVARERYGFLTDRLPLLFALCLFGSCVGYILAWRLFRWNEGLARATGLFLLIAAPLFAIRYAIQFCVFSAFPLTDLFQVTHLLKGAMEFARSDLLNPFVADSYLPVQQVWTGLLIRFGGLDPILSVWFYPFSAEVVRFLVFYSLTGALSMSYPSRVLALGMCLAVTQDFNPTNGGLAALGVLLLLSMLSGGRGRGEVTQQNLRLWLFVALALVLGWLATSMSAWAYVAGVIGLALYVQIAAKNGRKAATVAASVSLLVICLVPLHRSVLMFVPAVLLIAAVVAAYDRLRRHADASRSVGVLNLIGLMLLGVAAIEATSVLAAMAQGDTADFGLRTVFGSILKLFLGTRIDDPDVMPGVGGKVALFEVARAVSLLLLVLTIVLIGVTGDAIRRRALGYKELGSPNGVITSWWRAQALCTAALCLMIAALSGFPFGHRLAFLPTALLTLALSELFSIQVRGPAVRRAALAPLGMLAILVWMAIFGALAGLRVNPTDIDNPYLRMMQPLALALGVGLSILGLVMAGLFRRNRVAMAWTVAGAIVVALLWESQVVRVTFMPYAYGKVVPKGVTAVTHYGNRELKVAELLRREPLDAILVTDPATLAILRAETGLNAIVGFSNLDTMHARSRSHLAVVLGDLVDVRQQEPVTRKCELLISLLGEGLSPETNYKFMKQSLNGGSGADALASLGYGDGLRMKAADTPPRVNAEGVSAQEWLTGLSAQKGVRFVVVLSERTLRWASLQSGAAGGLYFPGNEPLDASMITRLKAVYGGTNVDGLVAVFGLNCGATK